MTLDPKALETGAEAVLALWRGKGLNNCSSNDMAEAAISAYLALSKEVQASEAVVVKALEWSGPNILANGQKVWGAIAEGMDFTYSIWSVGERFTCMKVLPQFFDSLEEAKVAVQQNYDERILSALATPQPLPATNRGAITEAIERLMVEMRRWGWDEGNEGQGIEQPEAATEAIAAVAAALSVPTPGTVPQLGGAPDDLHNLIKVVFADMTIEQMNTVCKEVIARRSAPSTPVGEGWQPTHRHVKRGSTYRLDGYGEIQTDTPLADYAKVAIYRAEDGTTWVRPVIEFEDGRFVALSSQADGEAE